MILIEVNEQRHTSKSNMSRYIFYRYFSEYISEHIRMLCISNDISGHVSQHIEVSLSIRPKQSFAIRNMHFLLFKVNRANKKVIFLEHFQIHVLISFSKVPPYYVAWDCWDCGNLLELLWWLDACLSLLLLPEL